MMSCTATPLRYPGGKTLLSNFFKSFIKENGLEEVIYVEPYCGGAGAAINLLVDGFISKAIINDANSAIYAFWYSVKYLSNDFMKMFEETPVSLEEWQNQRIIFKDYSSILKCCEPKKDELILKLGFATFYLNRCNRSGILSSGPIGGQSIESQLNAKSKIGARFNKSTLKEKLLKIIEKRDLYSVYNLDALTFLKEIVEKLPIHQLKNTFVYLDPPYYKQGSSLYLNYYKHGDHATLSEFLSKSTKFHWLLSYDNVKEIRKLYEDFQQYVFYINYSAQEAKVGSELLIVDIDSKMPESKVIKQTNRTKRIELYPI